MTQFNYLKAINFFNRQIIPSVPILPFPSPVTAHTVVPNHRLLKVPLSRDDDRAPYLSLSANYNLVAHSTVYTVICTH